MQPEDQVQMYGDVSIFDEDYPRALINLVPYVMKCRMLALKNAKEPLFLLDEFNLKKRCEPDSTTHRLKLTFWDEYSRAQDKGANMNIANVTRGVCTRDYFEKVVMNNDKMLSWIITPPKDYMIAMRDLLDLGLDELREIMSLPIKDPGTGKVDVKLISEKIKAFALVEQRVKGAIVQRHMIAQKNLNLNVDAPKSLEGMSLEDLEKMAEQLEGVEKKILSVLPEARPTVPGMVTVDIESYEEGS